MAPRRWPALSVRHLPSSRRCGGLGPAGRVGAEGESSAGTEAEEAEPPWEASGSDRRGLCSGGEKRKSHGGAPGALRTGARRAGASLGPSGCRAQRGHRTACGQKPREHRAAGGEGQAGVRARERGRPQGRRAAGQVAGTRRRGRPREGLCKCRSSEADRRGGPGPRVGGIAHRRPGAWPEERARARSSSSPCPCEEGRGGEGRGGKGGRKGAGSGPGVRAEGPASGRGWKRQCWHGEGGAIGTRAGGRVAGRGGLVAAAAGVGARLAGGEVFGSHAGGVLEGDKGKRGSAGQRTQPHEGLGEVSQEQPEGGTGGRWPG